MIEELKLYIDDEEIIVNGYFYPGEVGSYHSPGYSDEFEVVSVSKNSFYYDEEYIQENYEDELIEIIREQLKENILKKQIDDYEWEFEFDYRKGFII